MNASQTLSKRLSSSGIQVEVEYCKARKRYYGWATLASGQEIYLESMPRDLELAELQIVDVVLQYAR